MSEILIFLTTADYEIPFCTITANNSQELFHTNTKKILFMGNLVDFNNNPYLMKPLFLNVQLRTQIKICGKFSMDESFNLVYVRLEYHYYLIHYFI